MMMRFSKNKDSILNIFKNIPTLETERLILKKIVPQNSSDMYEYASDNEVTKYLTWESHKDLSESTMYISFLQKCYTRGDYFDWGIIYKPDNKFIGTCGFTTINEAYRSAEVGYVISKNYWGKGIAAEALNRVLEFAFEGLHFERIEAKHIEGNDNSAKVMKKCGMQFEGVLRKSMIIKGIQQNIHIYSILREEYEATRSTKP